MLLKGFAPGLEDALLALAGPESTAPLLLTEIRLMGGALAAPPGAAGAAQNLFRHGHATVPGTLETESITA